jgi:transcriptional regulator of acetoin/glycerol metabolism
MHVDCTLFSAELKLKLLSELSELLNISIEEVSLDFLVFDLNNKTFNLNELEKNTLLRVLSKSSGNISKTAKLLGVSRKTVYSLIKKYNVVNFITISD